MCDTPLTQHFAEIRQACARHVCRDLSTFFVADFNSCYERLTLSLSASMDIQVSMKRTGPELLVRQRGGDR